MTAADFAHAGSDKVDSHRLGRQSVPGGREGVLEGVAERRRVGGRRVRVAHVHETREVRRPLVQRGAVGGEELCGHGDVVRYVRGRRADAFVREDGSLRVVGIRRELDVHGRGDRFGHGVEQRRRGGRAAERLVPLRGEVHEDVDARVVSALPQEPLALGAVERDVAGRNREQ